jgi:hypothetical protein
LTAVARIAREQPKTLAQWLAHVAEVEGAKQRVAEHPTPRRLRRTTHATTCTWPPSRHGKPSPTVGPPRCGPVDPVSGIARCIRHRRRHLPQGEQLIGDWCELAPECGIAVTGEDDELRPRHRPGHHPHRDRLSMVRRHHRVPHPHRRLGHSQQAHAVSVSAAPERPRPGLSCGWAGAWNRRRSPRHHKARRALEREAAVAFENLAEVIAARAPEVDRAGRIVSLSERTEVLLISCSV